MHVERINQFNKIISTHNQYKSNSFLWVDIRDVWGVTEKKAKKLAKEYCNVISFYAVLKAGGFIDVSLYQFMSALKDEPLINKKGKKTKKKLLRRDGFLRNKKQICKLYDFDISKVYFETFNVVEGASNLDDKYFYQMKINQRWKGYHFMGCYIQGGILYLSDSSKRGIGVRAIDVIKKRYKNGRKCFRWIRLIG